MMTSITIAVLGDFDETKPSHCATEEAIRHSAALQACEVATRWVPSVSCENESGLEVLEAVDGVWGAPGDPDSSLGVIRAINRARTADIPYIGT